MRERLDSASSLCDGSFYLDGPGALRYRISLQHLFTIEELDQFVDLYEKDGVSESELHVFLLRNPKFLYVLGAYNAARSEIRFVSSIMDSSGRTMELRPDFLLQHASGYWDLLELKKPGTDRRSFVVGQLARKRFSQELSDGIAQVKTYLAQLHTDSVQTQLQKFDILVKEPNAFLLVGRDSSLTLVDRRALSRDLPNGTCIITYDELFELAKQRALIITTYSVPGVLVELRGSFRSVGAANLTKATELRSLARVEQSVRMGVIKLLVEPLREMKREWIEDNKASGVDGNGIRAMTREEFVWLSSYIGDLEKQWGCCQLDTDFHKAYVGGAARIDLEVLISRVEQQLIEALEPDGYERCSCGGWMDHVGRGRGDWMKLQCRKCGKVDWVY